MSKREAPRRGLEALKGEPTVSELASAYGVHPTMVHQWSEPSWRHRSEPDGERAARGRRGGLRAGWQGCARG